jgi:RimJ/RimL family protein N-acetyltransferase
MAEPTEGKVSMSIANFTTIETTRLRLRHFTDSDLPVFIAYRNDPVVAKYQSWEGISEPEASAFLQEQKEIQPGVPGQGMQIAIEFKETGVLVGDCYFTINEHDERQAEIGYTLSRAHQGQGFATEAVSCLLTYAFVTCNLHRIIAITDCENAASVALLERLGMRREGHFLQNVWFKGKWGDEYLYAILKEEWLNKHGSIVQK